MSWRRRIRGIPTTLLALPKRASRALGGRGRRFESLVLRAATSVAGMGSSGAATGRAIWSSPSVRRAASHAVGPVVSGTVTALVAFLLVEIYGLPDIASEVSREVSKVRTRAERRLAGTVAKAERRMQRAVERAEGRMQLALAQAERRAHDAEREMQDTAGWLKRVVWFLRGKHRKAADSAEARTRDIGQRLAGAEGRLNPLQEHLAGLQRELGALRSQTEFDVVDTHANAEYSLVFIVGKLEKPDHEVKISAVKGVISDLLSKSGFWKRHGSVEVFASAVSLDDPGEPRKCEVIYYAREAWDQAVCLQALLQRKLRGDLPIAFESPRLVDNPSRRRQVQVDLSGGACLWSLTGRERRFDVARECKAEVLGDQR